MKQYREKMKNKKDKKKWEHLRPPSHQKDKLPVLPAAKPKWVFSTPQTEGVCAIVWLDSVQNIYLSMVQMSAEANSI